MSALGQKQTFGTASSMSALPPKADISAISGRPLNANFTRPTRSNAARHPALTLAHFANRG